MIKRKKKMCKECGKERYIYAKGLCQSCYRYKQARKSYENRSNLKQNRITKSKRYNIPVRKKKRSDGFKNKITEFGFKSQIEWMEYQDKKWRDENGRLYCWLTGKEIHCEYKGEMWRSVWAHVLRKSGYTYWKLHPNNCRPLLPYVHHIVDNFTEDHRERRPEIDFDKWFGLQEQMKQEYKEWVDKFGL